MVFTTFKQFIPTVTNNVFLHTKKVQHQKSKTSFRGVAWLIENCEGQNFPEATTKIPTTILNNKLLLKSAHLTE
jgi:hypothetical protein